MADPAPKEHEALSQVFRAIGDSPGETITLDDLVRRFGARAFGAILFVFGAACMLPLPPGGTTIFGAPLVLLAPQVALGAHTPWLPGALRRREIRKADLDRVFRRIVPLLERVEAVSRPRLNFLFGSIGDRFIGLVCTVLALVLVLPIPLGNILPALAVSVLSLSLLQRDGAMAIVGYMLATASGSVLVLAAGLIMRTLRHLVTVITGA